MISIRALATLSIFAAASACDGKVRVGDVVCGQGTPTFIPPFETSVVSCGEGACADATSCLDGCRWCECRQGTWNCGTLCADADDGGATPAPTEPACPAVPSREVFCLLEGQRCSYPNGCGGIDVATCRATQHGARSWSVQESPCTECPASAPSGHDCLPPLQCAYPRSSGCAGSVVTTCEWDERFGRVWRESPCTVAGQWPAEPCQTWPLAGSACDVTAACQSTRLCTWVEQQTVLVSDVASCEGPGSQWGVSRQGCPGLPSTQCPSSPPAAGSTCNVSVDCRYDNGCGGSIRAHCTGAGGFAIFAEGCVAGCPAARPTSGASCATASASPCAYADDAKGCSTACYCATDLRWACLPSTCASP